MILFVIVAISACASEEPGAAVSPPTAASVSPTPTPLVSFSDGESRVVIHLSSVQGEGQTGTATFVSNGTTTIVEISIGPTSGEAQPIHIHAGICEDVGSVLHALQNVINGKSITTIDLSLSEIVAEGALVNVHASYADPSNYTACGKLPDELSQVR